MKETECRPRNHMLAAGKLYPNAWKQAEKMREDRGHDLPKWPDWCYLPLSGWYAIVSAAHDAPRLDLTSIGDVARLGALGTWRLSQGIYRFDPTLFDAIKSTPITGDLPCSVLYRLPEWCVYIESPGMTFGSDVLYGFFAHLEWDANTERHELRLLLDTEERLTAMSVHIGKWTLAEAIERVFDEATRQGGPEFISSFVTEISKIFEPIISLLLYLCSESAEIGDRPPQRPQPKKTKKGWKIFSPTNPVIWDVGVRLGASLRRAYQASNLEPVGIHASPRAHIRRAHWHTYRIGEQRSGSMLKWLPPIPVNIDDLNNLPSTIKKIQED